MKIRTIFVAATASSFLFSCGVEKGRTDYIIAYKNQSNGSYDVYDVLNNTISLQNDKYSGGPPVITEFGGALIDCSNSETLCMQSALIVSIPRNRMKKAWSAEAQSCFVTDQKADRYEVICKTAPQRLVRFSYTRKQGIINYIRECPNCPTEKFVLVGQRGLFAAPG